MTRTTGGTRGSRIADVRATTVSVPLETPLRHAVGAHWSRFVRTIVEVATSHLDQRDGPVHGTDGRRRHRQQVVV